MPHQPSKRSESHLQNLPEHLHEPHHHPLYPKYEGISRNPLGAESKHNLSHDSTAGYKMAHHHHYENVNCQDNDEHERMSVRDSTQFTATPSSSAVSEPKEKNGSSISHHSDEEAAATALLMSAGGPPRKKFGSDLLHKDLAHKRNTSTDEKSTDGVFHVIPSTNQGPQDEDVGVGDHDSIQGELRVKQDAVNVEEFPRKLHELLSSGDFTSIIHWMPNGKSWRVFNWHEFSNAMPKFFPKLCENDRGENLSLMNRMNSFLNEVQIWGFEKERDDAGTVCFCHEFFIKIAPNLCKYVKPSSKNNSKSSKSTKDEILSPPRIGRFSHQKISSHIDPIFSQQRISDGRGDVVLNSGILNLSPVTPSFILTNQVSPNSPQPRGRLQSNRGRPNRAERLRDYKRTLAFPVSKRGRSKRNVSSRGGRIGTDGLGIPRKLHLRGTSASPINQESISKAN